MKPINRKRWHYKLADLGSGNYSSPSNNLCTYFWQAVFGAFGSLVIILTGLMIAAVILALPLSLFVDVPDTALYSSVVIWAAAVVGGATAIKRHFSKQSEDDKEPSIVIEYIKAKKAKVCPILEFTDD